MFDQHPHDWQQDLALGDVVLFRFPTTEDVPDGETPKMRPCLVLDTPRLGLHRFAKLAYGTSAYGNSNRGREVSIRQPTSIEAAGLDRPSRFTLERTLLVSLDHPGFEAEKHGDPRIGRLDEGLMERLHALRARMQAAADIAADHRRVRLEERRRWQAEGRAAAQHNRRLLQGRGLAGGAR
ncbi:hypothetical protein [Alloyangia pacifica]|uniref:Type II toxin-antitoxin system PemK/MazF family toxin n=1 Tax=Alloyangia pacifica TaxID=311180 RepID=A0A1I6RJV0_9RHOB|nr:hypothetical protein [Alloyangia pacifica]SDG52421.1 hypothetical protein SAMN04488245_103140 [Alloyangia pacifica]SFS64926.1 hypothetical protein SAMN04488050_103140 [Alloyangia pacifica]